MRGLKPPAKPAGKRRAVFAAQVRTAAPVQLSGSGTPGQLAAWTGSNTIATASSEGWHTVGAAGEPAFMNGWSNWS